LIVHGALTRAIAAVLKRIAPQHQEVKVFLLLFRKTTEESSFLKKRSKRLLLLGPRRDPGLGRIG
jgi:hypothetical protein